MHALGEGYEASISPYIETIDKMIPLYSSVRAECITLPSELSASYWRSNLESPVLFCDAVRRILDASDVARTFLEIGPHSALSAPLRQTFQAKDTKSKLVCISTLIRNTVDARYQLMTTAGLLHANGVPVNLEAINGQGVTLSDLPPYPWQHTTRYLHESRLTRKWRFRENPHHELLGDRVMESSDWEPSWRNILRLNDVRWIGDHIIQGNVILPATGYVGLIGEAIRQLYPSQDDYSIRNMILKTPLLLKEADELEILTTLKQIRVSDIADSEWYTFSVMSHDPSDDSWTKHCHGLVRAGFEHEPEFRQIKPYARHMDVDRCHRTFERIGFKYGDSFQGLQSIAFDPTGYRASGTVADMDDQRSRYALHPATMDSVLQIFLLLTAKVQNITKGTIVPRAMGQIYVRGSASQISFEGGVCKTSAGQYLGDVIGVAGDQGIFSVSGLLGFPVSFAQGLESYQPLCSQIRWIPDIEMVAPDALLRRDKDSRKDQLWQDANRLCELCIMEAADHLRNLTAVNDHLSRWRQWVTTEADRLHQRDGLVHLDSKAEASVQSRQETITRILSRYAGSDPDDTEFIVFECVGQIMQNCSRIVLGEISALDVLEAEGRLERYSRWMQSQSDWSHFLTLLGHSNPTIRVLEIGSRTGATTEAVLGYLRSREGVRHYSQYTVTETCETSLTTIQQKLQHQQDIEYALLDISIEPEAQGFDLQSYDLIIASNVGLPNDGPFPCFVEDCSID